MDVDSSSEERTARELTRVLNTHLPVGVVGSVDRIREGDEDRLAPSELCGLESAIVRVRRASGAARRLARACCDQIGFPTDAIPRAPEGQPRWPAGLVGSLAHDEAFAAAVVARSDIVAALGVDLEPAEELEPGVVDRVVTQAEREWVRRDEFTAKALFSIKEAVFKAVYPLDGVFLEFEGVTVDQTLRFAETAYGRRVECRVVTQPRVLAVAWLTVLEGRLPFPGGRSR